MNEFESRSTEDLELQRELSRSLRRVDAPEGFAGRVMDRLAAEQKASSRRKIWLMPIAAMLLLGVAGGELAVERQREKQQEAILAQQQFEVAMRVTGRSLERMQRTLEHLKTEAEK